MQEDQKQGAQSKKMVATEKQLNRGLMKEIKQKQREIVQNQQKEY